LIVEFTLLTTAEISVAFEAGILPAYLSGNLDFLSAKYTTHFSCTPFDGRSVHPWPFLLFSKDDGAVEKNPYKMQISRNFSQLHFDNSLFIPILNGMPLSIRTCHIPLLRYTLTSTLFREGEGVDGWTNEEVET